AQRAHTDRPACAQRALSERPASARGAPSERARGAQRAREGRPTSTHTSTNGACSGQGQLNRTRSGMLDRKATTKGTIGTFTVQRMRARTAHVLPRGGDARHTKRLFGTVSNPPTMLLDMPNKLNNSIGMWPEIGHKHMCYAVLAWDVGSIPPLKSFI